jgi:hypothetical protein
MAAADPLDERDVMIPAGTPAELSGLAAEFPGYEFARQRTWGGMSIIALRQEGCARPGLYAVVTGDLDEMRRALLEHERPGGQPAAAVKGDFGCSGPGAEGVRAPG